MAPLVNMKGIGVFTIGEFALAGFALAQFAVAYSLVAQFGLYVHEGHAQFMRSVSQLLGSKQANRK